MLDPAPGFAADSDTVTAGAVSAALRDLLHSRLDIDHLPDDPIRHVAVCGGRVTVHLALRVSGAAELAQIEAAVAERIRALGTSEVEAVIPGLRVGLLDADIYGPSLPILLGVEDGSTSGTDDAGEAHRSTRGVRASPGELWILPRRAVTCDVPLSLAQTIELSGAVIVTQPARVATVEARKAGQMFASLGVPVLGVVENMTGPFGAGGGQAVSLELEVPFLGACHSMRSSSVRETPGFLP